MSEFFLRLAFEQFDERRLCYISQSMVRIYKVVAGIEVPIVFDNRNVTAGWTNGAEGMFLVEGGACGLFEDLDLDLSNIVVYPLVEDGAKKGSPGLSWNTSGAGSAITPR